MAQDETEKVVSDLNRELDEVLTETPVPAKRPKKTRAVVAMPDGNDLVRLAIEQDLDIAKLEKLIELRNAEIARTARAEFALHFAEMQAEFQPILRTKEAVNTNDGKQEVMYKYAPLEDIVKVVGPIIAKHGFSYRFPEEAIPESTDKRVWCVVSGHGHEERTYIDVPPVPTNRRTNSVQVRGIATAYGRRYSFLSAFGVVLEDEDDDAVSFDIDTIAAAAEATEAIRTAGSTDELRENFAYYYKGAKSDEERLIIMEIKDRRKAEFGGDDATTN